MCVEPLFEWFNAVSNEPRVRIVFSDDEGMQFDEPLRLDLGASSGWVDVLQMLDGICEWW